MMDSPEEPALSRTCGGRDSEIPPKHCKGLTRRTGQGEWDENVFTSMSHGVDLLSYPRARSLNSLSHIESGHSSNRLMDNNLRPESPDGRVSHESVQSSNIVIDCSRRPPPLNELGQSINRLLDSNLRPEMQPSQLDNNLWHERSNARLCNESRQSLNRHKDLRQESSDTRLTTKNVNKSGVHQFNLFCASKSDTNTCDNGLNSNQDKQSCQKHKVCLESVSNSFGLNAPSTSGASTSRASDSLPDNSGCNQSRKRPSSLNINKLNIAADDSSSDTGNDDYSLGSEDGCIYTYRGGEHLADLPSSFFSLDMGLPLDKHLPMPPNYVGVQPAGQNVREQGSRASSPDMDFLEMDFDPGPSCEVDTGDESTSDADLGVGNMPEEIEPVILRSVSPEYVQSVQSQPVAVASTSKVNVEPHYSNEPSTSRSTSRSVEPVQETESAAAVQTYGPYITHVNVRGEEILVRRTMTNCPSSHTVSVHASSGDLVSPREILNCKFFCLLTL